MMPSCPGCVIFRVAISTSATLIGPLTGVDFGLLKQGGGRALWDLTSASSQAAIAIGATVRPSSQVVTSLSGQPICSARSAALHLRVFRHSRNRPGIMSNLPAVRWSSRGFPPSSRSARPRPEARPALHDPLLTDVDDADTCCAARNISVEAAVRRLQPADSAMSISPSSSGFSALLHSVSWARNSLAGCVGDGTPPIPVIIFTVPSEVVLRRPLPVRERAASSRYQKSIPPPPGIAGTGASFFGFSATIASVVTSRPATDAASCSAVRTTLAGSITPWL